MEEAKEKIDQSFVEAAMLSFELNLSMISSGALLNEVIVQFVKQVNPTRFAAKILEKVDLSELSVNDCDDLLTWFLQQSFSTFEILSFISKFKKYLDEKTISLLKSKFV
jgi:hypothetical protein